jgi:hypothetical protein
VIAGAFDQAAVVLMPAENDSTTWVVGIGFGTAEREVPLAELLDEVIDDPMPGDDLATLRATLVRAIERIDGTL